MLAESLSHPDTATWRQIRLDEVRVERDPSVVVVFHVASWPECPYGFRFRTRIEPGLTGEAQATDADFIAGVLVTNLEELVEAADLGLPKHSRPGEITWVQ